MWARAGAKPSFFLGFGCTGRLGAGSRGGSLFEVLFVEILDHRLGNVIFSTVVHDLSLQFSHDTVRRGGAGGSAGGAHTGGVGGSGIMIIRYLT